MRHGLLIVPVGISLAAAAITGTAGAAVAGAHHAAASPPGATPSASAATFDSRAFAPPLRAGRTQAAAMKALLRSAGRGARITYDPIFATPRELLRYGGYLTGPSRAGGGAVAVARAWINTHRAARSFDGHWMRSRTWHPSSSVAASHGRTATIARDPSVVPPR